MLLIGINPPAMMTGSPPPLGIWRLGHTPGTGISASARTPSNSMGYAYRGGEGSDFGNRQSVG
jgi:hypothetical protein